MHVTTCVFLLRMIDELVHVALHRPIAAGRVRGEPTARAHRDLGGLLHRLHGEIFGRLDDDRPLATDPRNNRGPGRVPAGCGYCFETSLIPPE